MAAKGGHLEVLQWARANGCPWTASGARRRRRTYGYIESDGSLSDESSDDDSLSDESDDDDDETSE